MAPYMYTLLVLLVVMATVEGKRPKFCKRRACPRFSVTETQESYSVRSYRASNWVSTSVTCTGYMAAGNILYGRLMRYMLGLNSQQTVINMTTPMLMEVRPVGSPECSNNYTMMLYLPRKKGMKTPPTPLEPSVSVVSLEEMTPYVRSFSGYVLQLSTWEAEVGQLAADITSSGGSHEDGRYFIATYDPIAELNDRHNEVWLMKEASE